ncbi:hypothetical protein [Streptomyces sp. NBC_00271]|uniref:hypothetical protein n=1 Tax=Streptomyces sp. NBC_00271 TaxID=2975697 RepID=UPI002E2E7ADD|nr:hypothetical protein [Streptomyces sp. NBC_00271]
MTSSRCSVVGGDVERRLGEYSTHELGIQPEAYDPKLDVDFAPLREQGLTVAVLGQAA